MHASDVSLERFRPNGEKYSAGKITEPLIKITISNFYQTFENKYHLEYNFKKNINKFSFIKDNQIESPKSSIKSNINSSVKMKSTKIPIYLILLALNIFDKIDEESDDNPFLPSSPWETKIVLVEVREDESSIEKLLLLVLVDFGDSI